MPTTKKDAATERNETNLSATTIFDLLADDRRRAALTYLMQAVGAVPLYDLADQLALKEGDHTYEQYERIATGLVHNHIPKLADAGIVVYDADRETVELLEPAAQLTPYLDLATATNYA